MQQLKRLSFSVKICFYFFCVPEYGVTEQYDEDDAYDGDDVDDFLQRFRVSIHTCILRVGYNTPYAHNSRNEQTKFHPYTILAFTSERRERKWQNLYRHIASV